MNYSNFRSPILLILASSITLLSACGGGSSESGEQPQPIQNPPPTSTNNLSINSVDLVNANTLEVERSITQNAEINLNDLPQGINFVINVTQDSNVESVAAEISGCASLDRTENLAPYTLAPEDTGLSNINSGDCTISAVAFEQDNGQGQSGPEFAVTFSLTSDNGSGDINSAPSITLLGNSVVNVSLGSTYTESGATASDAEDGDLNASIQITGQVNTLIAGTYILTYLVADAAGLTASANRTVIVQGNQAPVINVIGNSTSYTPQGETYADQGAIASDDEDGDLTGQIQTSSNVNTANLGSYEITYSVTDSAGSEALAIREVIVVPPGSASNDIDANIISLTRVNGVSPETIYFNADDSTCSDCSDVFGLGTAEADAYSALSYHFDFDDTNSGVFSTTGKSRNTQIGGSPRAAHTFECSGSNDPNWDAASERCEFDVGVRVQAPDGDYNDAFVRINIQPMYGIGGYYPDSDIYCVSSTSGFTDCPHSDSARHFTDTPWENDTNNWNGALVLYHNNGGSYSRICIGADDQNATAATYGTGARPLIENALVSARPGQCNGLFDTNARVAELADNHPERDTSGNLIDGFAFGATVTGLRLGNLDAGTSLHMVTFHDLDLDWSGGGAYSGEVSLLGAADWCARSGTDIDCSNVPYAAFVFITDSVIIGNPSNLPSPTTIGCFNGCGLVNAVIMGNEVNRADEHNIRIMGNWGTILSNNWVRGDHVGGSGAKSRITLRAQESPRIEPPFSGVSLTNNPEDLTGTNYLRTDLWYNRYLTIIDNRFNQASHQSGHASFSLSDAWGHMMVVSGNEYIDDGVSGCCQLTLEGVRYVTVRDQSWEPNRSRCRQGTAEWANNTPYNDSDDVYFEGNVNCGPGGNNVNVPALAIPSAPEKP